MTPFEEWAEGLEWGDDEPIEKLEQLELFTTQIKQPQIMEYIYHSDKLTDLKYKKQPCKAVRKNGKCRRGKK